jgi:hypothetical protein
MSTYKLVPNNNDSVTGITNCPLKFLNQAQVVMVDEALCELGDYGELHLVVDKGRLRFIVLQKSYDANKWKSDGR